MAVQIPRITPNDSQPQQAPRITATPADAVSPMMKTQAALEGAGKEIIRYRDQMAYQEADNIGTDADNKYQDWHQKEMYGDPASGKVGLIFKQGDPKALYEDFNKRAKEKLDELSTAPKDQNWSDQTQNVVNRRLNRRDDELRKEELTQYGHQKYKFETDNRDANVKFAQQAMPNVAAAVVPDRIETFGPLQAKIQDIKAPIINHALQYGGAIKTEDGQVLLTPATQQEIKKEISEGLYKTIDNMYNSDTGDGVAIKKAEAIKEQFADQLDPLHKDTLATKAQKSVQKQKATELAEIIARKGPNAPELADAPFDVKKDAVKMANEYRRGMDQMKESKQKDNYDTAAKYVDQIQRSGQPFPGVMAMQNDKTVSQLWGNMSSKQQQTLEHMVEQPKDDSQSALNKMVNLFEGKNGVSPRGMSQEDFAQYKSGLTKQTQNKYQNLYEKMNVPTNSQMETDYRLTAKEFDRQAIGAKLLHYVPNSTTFTASDQIKEPLLRKELQDSLDGQPPMSPKERSDYVAKFIFDKQHNAVFTPPERKTFKSVPESGTNPPPSPNPSPSPSAPSPKTDVSKVYGNLTAAARKNWIQQYKKDNKTVPNEDQLIDFISKKTQ